MQKTFCFCIEHAVFCIWITHLRKILGNRPFWREWIPNFWMAWPILMIEHLLERYWLLLDDGTYLGSCFNRLPSLFAPNGKIDPLHGDVANSSTPLPILMFYIWNRYSFLWARCLFKWNFSICSKSLSWEASRKSWFVVTWFDIFKQGKKHVVMWILTNCELNIIDS